MRNVIVVVTPTTVECWGNFKKMCEEKGISYNYLKSKKLPLEYREYKIYRLPML